MAKRFHNLGGKGHSLGKRCWQLGMYLDGYIIRTVYQKNIFCKKKIYFAAVAINLEHFGIHMIYSCCSFSLSTKSYCSGTPLVRLPILLQKYVTSKGLAFNQGSNFMLKFTLPRLVSRQGGLYSEVPLLSK